MLGILSGIVGGVTAVVKGVRAVKKAFKKPKPIVRVTQEAAASLGYPIGGGGYNRPSFGSMMQTVASRRVPATVPTTVAPPAQSPGGLPIPYFKGPGGKLQMPWSDPRVPGYLKQFALDDAYLKVYYRAPKGYVVVRDPQGRPFAVSKVIARQFGLWKPKRKPPISVGDWQAFKKAERVEKKLKRIAGPALRKRGYRAASGRTVTATATARTRRK
jgi:hypothetical protein